MQQLFILLLVVFLAISPVSGKTYLVDSEKSSITFAIKEIRKKLVHGQFNTFTGTVQWTPKNLSKSKISGTIETNSVYTKKKLRDRHLRDKRFFNAKVFPKITYKSTKITKTKTGYMSDGILTVKDVQTTVRIPFTITTENNQKRIQASSTLDRHQLGITSHKKLIKKMVNIHLDVVLTPKPKKPATKK